MILHKVKLYVVSTPGVIGDSNQQLGTNGRKLGMDDGNWVFNFIGSLLM